MTLTDSIKQKKEFSGLPDAFVNEHIDAYFKSRPQAKKQLEAQGYNEKSQAYKQAVKEVRAQLREIYGVFQQAGTEKRRRLLENYLAAKGRGEQLKQLDKLLQSHQSTKERKDHYKEIYENIFPKQPEHILDLGCGFNPLAYQWLPGSSTYSCCDLSPSDMDLINKFFSAKGIDGEAFALDLLDAEARKRLQNIPADTALMLKLIDTLETQERNVTKTIITELQAHQTIKHIIASFPLQSIGGRHFRQGGKENWFSKFLATTGCAWERQEIAGEEFYIISF